jgi:hypothetical protein
MIQDRLIMIYATLIYTFTDKLVYTFLVFTYCDDIMYPITLVCGPKIQRRYLVASCNTIKEQLEECRNLGKGLVSVQEPKKMSLRTSRSVATSQFLPVLPQVSSTFRYPHTSATVCPEVCAPVNSTSTLYRIPVNNSGRET